MMIKVFICDDHPIVRQGLKQTLADSEDIQVTGESGDGAGLMEQIRDNHFDVILLDISIPGKGGIEILKQVKSLNKRQPVLMLSTYPEDQYALRSLKAGASGYLTKNCAAEDLVAAIRKVAKGGKYISNAVAEEIVMDMDDGHGGPPHKRLSDREYEVLCHIASGQSVSQISEGMNLSVKTISTYRARILEKMRMKNNAELTHYAIKNDLVA